MPICSAQTPTKRAGSFPGGVTFAELVAVVFILSLIGGTVITSFFGLLNKTGFNQELNQFASTIEKAAFAASQSEKRFEVIIDPVEQYYILREVTNTDLSEVLEEEIIVEKDFSNDCFVNYIKFDDGESTNTDRAKFRANRFGWQYGGVIVFTNAKGQPYTVTVSRVSRKVKIERGEAFPLEPKTENEIAF